MAGLERARAIYADPAAYANECHAAGRRLVGFFCDSLPIEIIDAAGFVAHRVTGYPAPPDHVLDTYLFALLPKTFWQVRQTDVEFLNHTFGRVVNGTYDALDALVIPNTRKPLLNLFGAFKAAQASDPGLTLPELIVLDRAATPAPSAAQFNLDSVNLFCEAIARLADIRITARSLREAITLRRENKQLMQTINGWRQMDGCRLSGADFLAVAGCSMFMAPEDFRDLALQIIEDGPGEMRTGMRVFIGGSPPDNDVLYRLIEADGATVVGEDHCWGERCADILYEDVNDPLDFLNARWTRSAACAFRLPYQATLDNVVRMARNAKAEAAILNVFRGDEMQIWDTPGEVGALKEAGFPVLHLKEQPHILASPDALGAEISDFLSRASVPGISA